MHIEDFDVFFGDQHRMKGEEAEQQFNKLARSVLKIAEVNDARNSEGRTGRTRHVGVFIAVDGASPSIVNKEQGTV